MSLEQLKITQAKIVETTEGVMRGTETHLVCEGVDVAPMFLGKSLFGNNPQTCTEIIETIQREPTLEELCHAESLDTWAERCLELAPVSNEQQPKEVLGNLLAGGLLGYLFSLSPSIEQQMVIPGTTAGTLIGATTVALLMRKAHIHSSPSNEELLNRRNEIAKNAAPTLARLQLIRNAIAELKARQTDSVPE